MTGRAARTPFRAASRRRVWLRVVALGLGAILLVSVGIAVGMALQDRPVPGGTQTLIRTLEPLPQQEP